jgi:hypothetical protein
MAFTHVYRAMEIAPLIVIPYKPKLQKPSNRIIHNIPSKPLIRQPSSFNASRRTDPAELTAETLPESSWVAKKNAEDSEAAAGNAVALGDGPRSARGMRSDCLLPSDRLDLTISRLDEAHKYVGSEK